MQAIPNSLPDKDASYLHAGGVPIGAYDPKYENPERLLPGPGGRQFLPEYGVSYVWTGESLETAGQN